MHVPGQRHPLHVGATCHSHLNDIHITASALWAGRTHEHARAVAGRKAEAGTAGHLAAVGTGPGVGHGHGVRAVVPQVAADLVAKLAAPDGLTPRAISCGPHIAGCTARVHQSTWSAAGKLRKHTLTQPAALELSKAFACDILQEANNGSKQGAEKYAFH